MLLSRAGPDDMLDTIRRFSGNVCFTAPIAYRAMLGKLATFFFSSRRRHTSWTGDWSSDVCSSDLFVLSSMELSRGGEIFVPKIPSTTVTDLATYLCPKLGQKTVGIRPGEKLHETMIPADDSRWTVELDDRYVILASFAAAAREVYLNRGAKPVAEGFGYSSDKNSERLDA